MQNADFRQRYATDAAAFLMIFIWIAFLARVLSDGDTWWHLGAGRWIVAHHSIPAADPFSFSQPGAAWHAHEWGAEIIMWLTYSAGGLAALICLVATAAGLAAAILCHFMQRHLAPVPSVAIAVAASLCLMTSAWARPHLLALPLLVLWAVALFSERDNRPPPLAWALLIVLWANLHASFLLGLLLIGPAALEALVRSEDRWTTVRRWAIFGIAAAFAGLITPYGINGFIYPLQVSSMTSLQYIAEWNPLSIRNGPLIVGMLLVSLALFFSLGLRLTVIRALTYVFLLYMAFSHIRHQFVFGYLSWVLIAAALGEAIARSPLARWKMFKPGGSEPQPADSWALGGLAATCALLIAARLALPVGIEEKHGLPTAMVERLPAALRQAPVFNEYSFGGPLIFAGIRPFIDGRADMYGDAFVQAYVRAEDGDAAEWRRIERRYGIVWTILPPGSRLVPILESAGWRKVMADDRAVVHVRPSSRPPSDRAGG